MQSKHYFGPLLEGMSKNRRYLVANRTDAVIYAGKATGGLSFLQRLTNPSGRRHESEMVSDQPGTVRSSAAGGTIHHGLDRNQLRHNESAKKFAGVIARVFKQECEKSGCAEVVLVAEPHFLGLLRAALPEPLRKKTIAEIPREFVHLTDDEMAKQILCSMRG